MGLLLPIRDVHLSRTISLVHLVSAQGDAPRRFWHNISLVHLVSAQGDLAFCCCCCDCGSVACSAPLASSATQFLMWLADTATMRFGVSRVLRVLNMPWSSSGNSSTSSKRHPTPPCCSPPVNSAWLPCAGVAQEAQAQHRGAQVHG